MNFSVGYQNRVYVQGFQKYFQIYFFFTMVSKFDSSNLYNVKFVLNHFKVSNLSVITRQHIKKCQVHVIFALKFLNQVGISSNTKVQYTLKIFLIVMNVPKSFPLLPIWETMLRKHMKKYLLNVQFVRIDCAVQNWNDMRFPVKKECYNFCGCW